MLYGLLVAIFIFICVLLVLIVLVQQSKGGGGIPHLGGTSQILFGGSGGQDLLQKATWVLAALFMGMSLLLSLIRSNPTLTSRFTNRKAAQQVPQLPRSTASQKN